MDDTKPFYLSKRFWGAVFGAAGIILPMFGIGNTDDIAHGGTAFMGWLDATMALGGWAVAFYGGMTAKQKLTFRR